MNRALVLLLLCACDCGTDPSDACTRDSECALGSICVDSVCVAESDGGPGPDAPSNDGGNDVGLDDSGSDAGDAGSVSCEGIVCQDDSRCVLGVCTPWEPGEADEMCRRVSEPGPVTPQLQCAWTGQPEGTSPNFRNILHTPLVADFGVASGVGSPSRPSIVVVPASAITSCLAPGVVQLLDGATCEPIDSLQDDESLRLQATVTPALGDIDGDGFPEIVAAGIDGGLLAFDVARPSGELSLLWRSTAPGGGVDDWKQGFCSWTGVSLVDLNDDDEPEIFYEGAVWNNLGERIAIVPGWLPTVSTGSFGTFGDFDADGNVELVGAGGLWEWTGAEFVLELAFPFTDFYSAVADFGDYGVEMGDAPGQPEIVSVRAGIIRVQTLDGTVVFTATTGESTGGPPTIADYDGDGAPEIGAAFGGANLVVDPADDATLWSVESQDRSSARTGSSVFDFNGDGRAEVVYADECYMRVYDGPTGDVLFSQPRFSSTWNENPVVADVDGDSAAEVVVGATGPCRTDDYCPSHDPIFPGLRCEAETDCPGGACVEGLCRCTTNEECGDDYDCQPPLAGTAGDNVCRSFHRECETGIRVYRDARDRWAPSRGIWNQHAYYVTNVEEDGSVPRQSAVRANWSEEGLNNFRQNVQGSLADVPGPDLSVGGLVAVCVDEDTRIEANVCNRGASFLDAGVEVIFRQTGGEELCRLRTADPVAPGECSPVSCLAPVQAEGEFEAVVDPDGTITECIEDNNGASGTANCII